MPLSIIKNNFTHYDLHYENVFLYEPLKNKYIEYHYYKGQDKDAFLGLSNTTGYLEWYDNGTELSSVYNGTNYGTFKTGGIILTNTTTSTSTTTGALIVKILI